MFKILNEFEHIDRIDSRINHRGHEATSTKDQCRLDIRKYSVSQRKINEWNTLSTDCACVSIVSVLRTKLTNCSEGRVTHI